MNIFPQSFVVKGMEGRDISQEYRELELLSEVELTPESRTRVDVEGEVLGIYESFRGVKEAIARNDADMALFFLTRLNPVAKERLIYELQKGSITSTSPYQTLAQRSVMQALGLSVERFSPLNIEVEEIASRQRPFPAHNFAYRKTLTELHYLVTCGLEEALEQNILVCKKSTKANRAMDVDYLFISALKSGRVDFVNRALESFPKHLPYPRVEEAVTEVDFVTRDQRFVEDFVLRKEEHKLQPRHYSDALEGGNPRLFVYIFAISDREPFYDAFSLLAGYTSRRDLLNRYMCAQFFPLSRFVHPSGSSIDLHRILSQKLPEEERKDHALKFVLANLGNVDILFYILDIYPEERDFIAQTITDKHQGLYPLSERILANVS
jgi:hypothetical protein